ncbi:MAG: MoaD/ThiS family protein [Firmicutes bacterium]|nr:MoaD/ThiS family protein [Bacillota bacterium]
MRIVIKLFAQAAELAKAAQMEAELQEPATVQTAVDFLAHQNAALAKLLPNCAVALNRRYTHRNATLGDGDELAIIPPVSGGSLGGHC